MRHAEVTIMVEVEDDSGWPTMYRVTGDFNPGIPGRLSGPPELCYPHEGADFEITRVTTDDGADVAEDPDFDRYELIELAEAEYNELY